MARLDGRFVRLQFDSNFVKGVVTSSIDLTADMIDITNYESDANKEFLSGEKSATINVDFTFDSAVSSANFSDLFNAFNNGTLTAFVYGDSNSGGDVLTGNCYVSSLNLTGDKNTVGTCNATLTTSGAITLDIAS